MELGGWERGITSRGGSRMARDVSSHYDDCCEEVEVLWRKTAMRQAGVEKAVREERIEETRGLNGDILSTGGGVVGGVKSGESLSGDS